MKKLVIRAIKHDDLRPGRPVLFMGIAYSDPGANVWGAHNGPAELVFIDTETGEETPVEFVS